MASGAEESLKLRTELHAELAKETAWGSVAAMKDGMATVFAGHAEDAQVISSAAAPGCGKSDVTFVRDVETCGRPDETCVRDVETCGRPDETCAKDVEICGEHDVICGEHDVTCGGAR